MAISATLSLFESLKAEEWDRSTVCPGWSVKDVGLHLLGDEVGVLSRSRDGFRYGSPDIGNSDPWSDLVQWLNRWNEQWVEAMRRISPNLLIELLRLTGEEIFRFFGGLDQFKLGGAVTWAGPEPAPICLDMAREHTERWVHHQQIRDALDKPGLKEPRFFAPVLATFVRALPHTFHDVTADEGTVVTLVISGESGGEWSLVREGDSWKLYADVPSAPDSSVVLDQDVAWRLFTKGISKSEAISASKIEGDQSLGLKVLDTVSIIA